MKRSGKRFIYSSRLIINYTGWKIKSFKESPTSSGLR